ncbi:MAG TPA: preprotein translocase subunit SecG [Anaerolineae bacterium]|nr:preprotein translocase subunit SecG [Anaerolineae bacterium]
MQNAVSIAQIILSVVLIIMIMLEVRGSSMGGFMSGGDSPVYRTRRGFERTLFNLTVLVAILYFILSIWNVILTG